LIWFWLGFFVLVGLLLVLDLGVLHRKPEAPSLKSAIGWTIGWVVLGLSFSGIVYLIYENHWLGVEMHNHQGGADAAVTYVSAYLLEQALSVDNLFVILTVFGAYKVPLKYQHRVLFWGILGAIVFRVTLLGGGSFLAQRFHWIFYVFGGYLAYQGIQLWRKKEDEHEDVDKSIAIRMFRKVVPIVDGDHGGKFAVKRASGRWALTMLALCLLAVEVNDIVFALDSIPAVLSVSSETFIVVTSNIFAIMGLRSLYFVLAGAMEKFDKLKYALSVLLIFIGVKMLAHEYIEISHVVSLCVIAGILAIGVAASMMLPADPTDPPPEP
jgi:tellurite resistance protein TerC